MQALTSEAASRKHALKWSKWLCVLAAVSAFGIVDAPSFAQERQQPGPLMAGYVLPDHLLPDHLLFDEPSATERAANPSQSEPQNPPDEPEKQPGNPGRMQATFIKIRDLEADWLTGPFVGKEGQLVALTNNQRLHMYLQQTLTTPGAYIRRAFSAGFDQAFGTPRQWDDGWGGYAERFASEEGQFIASNSVTAFGNALLGYEDRYDQCRCTGFWPRTHHAIVRNFVTYNRTEHERRPQWALYAGAFAGGAISATWKPGSRNSFTDGGLSMASQAGWGTLLNFFIEFADDINRKLGGRKKR